MMPRRWIGSLAAVTALLTGVAWLGSYRYGAIVEHTSGIVIEVRPGWIEWGRLQVELPPNRSWWRVYARYAPMPVIGRPNLGPYWSTDVRLPLAAPFALAATLSAWFLWPPRRGCSLKRCQTCSYDLAGNATGVCPECGKAVLAEHPARAASAQQP